MSETTKVKVKSKVCLALYILFSLVIPVVIISQKFELFTFEGDSSKAFKLTGMGVASVVLVIVVLWRHLKRWISKTADGLFKGVLVFIDLAMIYIIIYIMLVTVKVFMDDVFWTMSYVCFSSILGCVLESLHLYYADENNAIRQIKMADKRKEKYNLKER